MAQELTGDLFGGLLGSDTGAEAIDIPTTNLHPAAVPSTEVNGDLTSEPAADIPGTTLLPSGPSEAVGSTENGGATPPATSPALAEGGDSVSTSPDSVTNPIVPSNSDTTLNTFDGTSLESDMSGIPNTLISSTETTLTTGSPSISGAQILSTPSALSASSGVAVPSTPSTHIISSLNTGTNTLGNTIPSTPITSASAVNSLASTLRTGVVPSSLSLLSTGTLTSVSASETESAESSIEESTEAESATESPIRPSQEMVESVTTSKGQDTTLFITSLVPAATSTGRLNAAAANGGEEEETNILNSDSKLFPLGVVLVVAGGTIALVCLVVFSLRCIGLDRRRRKLRAAIPSFFPTVPDHSSYPDPDLNGPMTTEREKYNDDLIAHPAATHAQHLGAAGVGGGGEWRMSDGYWDLERSVSGPGSSLGGGMAGAGAGAGVGGGLAGVGGYDLYNRQTYNQSQGSLNGHARNGSYDYEYDHGQPQPQAQAVSHPQRQAQPQLYIQGNPFGDTAHSNVVDPYDGAAFYAAPAPAQTQGSTQLNGQNYYPTRNNSQSSRGSVYSDTYRSDNAYAYANGSSGGGGGGVSTGKAGHAGERRM